MKWNYEDYIKWLKNGHIINENVLELDISNHYIQNIDYINNLPMLQTLNFNGNQITQLNHINLPMLQTLNCDRNKITQLDNLNLPMLQVLYCGNNKITQLDNLNHPMLRKIECHTNKITQLDNLNLPMLQILYCCCNKITQLDNFNHPMLQKLVCEYNQLTQLDNLNLPMLQVLVCSCNKITQLDNLSLPMLERLECGYNKLTQIDMIGDHLNLPMLQNVNCYYNQITQLDNINLPMLQGLVCNNNQITQLDNINLPMLEELNCSFNQITQLDNLNLPMLQDLNCGDTQITQLRLQHVQNLRYIQYRNNMIEFIAPNLLRVINNTNQHIYTDSQNVHNHNIQECIRKSISNLINIPPTIQSLSDYIVNNTILTEQSKQLLFEYIEDKTVHSTLLITFEELLLHTMSVINKDKHADEILKIMNIELNDSLCKCYTGRMSRIINCLNGFSDLVQVQISESEQIGQIISIVKDMLIDKDEYTVEKHKELSRTELVNRGYSNDTIETWIAFIE